MITLRTGLKQINEERKTFSGIFKRYGTKSGWNGFPERTILLINIINIKDSNHIVTDHCWFTLTKQFEELGDLIQGDIIQFDARVKEYIKGWQGHKAEEYGENSCEIDYKLSHPTKIKKINNDHSYFENTILVT